MYRRAHYGLLCASDGKSLHHVSMRVGLHCCKLLYMAAQQRACVSGALQSSALICHRAQTTIRWPPERCTSYWTRLYMLQSASTTDAAINFCKYTAVPQPSTTYSAGHRFLECAACVLRLCIMKEINWLISKNVTSDSYRLSKRSTSARRQLCTQRLTAEKWCTLSWRWRQVQAYRDSCHDMLNCFTNRTRHVPAWAEASATALRHRTGAGANMTSAVMLLWTLSAKRYEARNDCFQIAIVSISNVL